MIPRFKNEIDVSFIYGYDIKIDASNSIDESNLREDIHSDPLLLFSWDCPEIFNNICKDLHTPNNKNSILLLKFSDYKNLFKMTNKDLSLEVKLKLNKNNRYAEKKLGFLFKNPIKDFGKLIVIDNEYLGLSDVLFKSSLLDTNIDMNKFKYNWNIKHFKSESQYLNGQKEMNLRIKYDDLLNGINNIELTIIDPILENKYYKEILFEKAIPPYGGNCFLVPSIGYSFLTEFSFIVSDWISSFFPLLYKIKYLDSNNIPVDISDGGFAGEKFVSNKLPVGKSFILEITDIRGVSKISYCKANVKINQDLKDLDYYTKDIFDITKKLLISKLYETNKISEDVNLNQLNKKVDMINLLFESINQEHFLKEYDIIISTLIIVSNNDFDNDKIDTINKLLNIIVKFIDPLLNSLPKIQNLYSILDNINKKTAKILESNFKIMILN